MNEQQLQAAQADMIKWLSDPHELGKRPFRIERAGEFELHGMRYCIFRYKTGLLRPWLVGVSGGFEGEDTEPCGHTFSDGAKYDAASAQNDCVMMVERIRMYWMEQAKKYSEPQ